MIILIKLKRTRYDCADLHTVIRFRSAHVHKLGFQTRTVRHASIGTLQTKQLPDKEHESHTGKKKRKRKKKKETETKTNKTPWITIKERTKPLWANKVLWVFWVSDSRRIWSVGLKYSSTCHWLLARAHTTSTVTIGRPCLLMLRVYTAFFWAVSKYRLSLISHWLDKSLVVLHVRLAFHKGLKQLFS